MHIETLPVRIAGDNLFTTNCYIVSQTPESDCVVIIDPGDEADRILEHVAPRKIEAVLITHGHYDHIGAVVRIASESSAKIYAHQDDAAWIEEAYEAIKGGYQSFAKHRSLEIPKEETDEHAPRVDVKLADADVLQICGLNLEVIHTPGHSKGSVCFYNPKEAVLFSGDTLFKGTCGRTDFVGGSPEQMHNSLVRLSELPLETTVYPGHDALTSIGAELNRGLKAY